MSLLLNQPSKLCLRKPVFVRSSPLVSSSTSLQTQTPPCWIINTDGYGNLRYNDKSTVKKLPRYLVINNDWVTIGSSHGWVATLKKDGIMRSSTVYKLDEEGNAVYTQGIGGLVIFLSKSEPFCAHASSFPGERPNMVRIWDDFEYEMVSVLD